jgi:hypothetical protein
MVYSDFYPDTPIDIDASLNPLTHLLQAKVIGLIILNLNSVISVCKANYTDRATTTCWRS